MTVLDYNKVGIYDDLSKVAKLMRKTAETKEGESKDETEIFVRSIVDLYVGNIVFNGLTGGYLKRDYE